MTSREFSSLLLRLGDRWTRQNIAVVVIYQEYEVQLTFPHVFGWVGLPELTIWKILLLQPSNGTPSQSVTTPFTGREFSMGQLWGIWHLVTNDVTLAPVSPKLQIKGQIRTSMRKMAEAGCCLLVMIFIYSLNQVCIYGSFSIDICFQHQISSKRNFTILLLFIRETGKMQVT